MASFIPLILITLIMAAFAWPMTKRKGLSIGYFILCIIPLFGGLPLIWVASKTDKTVLDAIADLESKVS